MKNNELSQKEQETMKTLENEIRCPKSPDGEHLWIEVKKPPYNWSGWHVDRCYYCGKEREYDTSD